MNTTSRVFWLTSSSWKRSNQTGKPWTKVKSWFGYGLHLIADTHYEQPVAFRITPASHSEQTELKGMIEEHFASDELSSRCRDFSADRNTLKYRCPAAAYGFDCPGKKACANMGEVTPGDYGRIVRINLAEHNRRIFVRTPYGSPSWKRGYNRRSALERINGRLDNSFGFEKHYIRGKSKMTTRVGLALAVMMAMALGHVMEGRSKQMRSLVRPVPIASSG